MPRTQLPASSRDYSPSSGQERTSQLIHVQYDLGPNAGIRVSPLCLGAMSLGNQSTSFMGSLLDHEQSAKFLDYYYEAGGNFIDTANTYQGRFKSPEENEKGQKEGKFRAGMEPSENEIKISRALQDVANEIGGETKLTSVALAWARQTVAYCFPIVGGSSIEYLKSTMHLW
ncbi:uncharacterized protein I206_106730 [Kwoniella pini CBS 10737]|uniref:NADP-dependent oxidoreductase domain-containing protein n=1 Tax=Kwoniella pini CBS 10737 TaxID=1296096 RepID=A0A1B9HTE2_9TREE|nr:uncharacterized protein I206_07382 [Kwoniella pini CBS 10737]OCF46529.1 hypothetical protein I206_07382 [Kwoniella pini CBS 10737]